MSEAEKSIDTDIRGMIEQNSREARCKWCHPDENGNYNAARFESPDQKGLITLFFGGAAIAIDMNVGTEHALLKLDISFCPMCGRRVRAEGQAK